MNETHPNIELLKQFDPANMAASAHVFAEDAIFHYFNPKLPDLQGDYVGPKGIQSFFEKIGGLTKGTFRVNPVNISAVGDELVFVQSKNTLVLEDQQIETDVVIIWRIVDNQIKEVWDIPSVYSAKTIDLNSKL